MRFTPPAFRGVFGPPLDTGKTSRVAFTTATATAAYDHNNAIDPAGIADPRLAQSGFYSGVAATMDFVARGKRSSFTAVGNTDLTRYQVVDAAQSSYHVGLGFTAPIGRDSLHASQTLSYSPLYEMGLFAGLPPTGSTDVNISGPGANLNSAALREFNSVTAVDFTHQLTRRVSLGAFYDFRRSRFDEQAQYDLDEHRVGVRYLHTLTKHATLHLEYALRSGRYAQPADGRNIRRSHDIVAGVEYARTLSFSQKTQFTFSTGSSLLVDGTGSQNIDNGSRGNHLYVTGNASLVRYIGRTWLALGTYNRAVQFEEGFLQPFLNDSVTASLSGYLGPRVTLSLNASYSSGTVGTHGVANSYNSYVTSAYTQTALGRYLAIFAQALYYHYQFDGGVNLPTGLPEGLDRTGVRVGLTTWLPLQRGKD